MVENMRKTIGLIFVCPTEMLLSDSSGDVYKASNSKMQ